jgi:hypothetical protein
MPIPVMRVPKGIVSFVSRPRVNNEDPDANNRRVASVRLNAVKK